MKHLLAGPFVIRKANPEVRSHYADNFIDIQLFVYISRLIRQVAPGLRRQLQVNSVTTLCRSKRRQVG